MKSEVYVTSVFEAPDYKAFLQGWIKERPKGGRGESRRMAEQLGVSTTLVSQVINGEKHFTMETASDLCDHMRLSERETDHFMLLVDLARAGSEGLRRRLRRRVDQSRMTARKLSERVEKDRDLTNEQSSIYYSHWVYTGVTNLMAVESHLTIDQLAERLQAPAHLIGRVMAFLLESGILINKNGTYEVGVKLTHIGADSPLVVKHHQNWRLRGFDRMPYAHESKTDLFYTAPMSLSQEVAEKIRADLPAYIERIVNKWVGPSTSEVVRCLNIDWFSY
jgi:uncharacterized protein (TIGR02147 family)